MKKILIPILLCFAAFAARAQITVISPNGGEVIGNGNVVQVYFSTSSAITSPQAELYSGSTKVWGPVSVIPNTYMAIPTSGLVTGTLFKVRVYDGSSPSVEDWSDNYFELSASWISNSSLRTNSVLVSGVKDESAIASLMAGQYVQETRFFDNLDRPRQIVRKGASASGKDEVAVFNYDALGKTDYSFLPMTSSESQGEYKRGILGSTEGIFDQTGYTSSKHYTFYKTASDRIADDGKAFSRTIYEKSPLSRVLEQGGVGESWQPGFGSSSYTVKQSYTINTSSDNVIQFSAVQNAYNSVAVTAISYYRPNTLSVVVTTDDRSPDHPITKIYEDRLGNVVLKRQQIGATAWKDTYYVFDVYGRQLAIIPPEALSRIAFSDSGLPSNYTLLTSNTSFSSTNTQSYVYDQGVKVTLSPGFKGTPSFSIRPYGNPTQVTASTLADYVYLNTYDTQNRLIGEKTPGADWVYYVYDKRDRPCLTQDGNLRSNNQWLFVKYDLYDRVILNGIVTLSGDIEAIRTAAENSSVLYETSGFAVHGYTNNAYPNVADESAYNRVTYYDNYSFKSFIGAPGYDYKNDELAGLPAAEYARIWGAVTGEKVKCLEDNTWVWRVHYFDGNLLNVQSVIGNFKGGTSRESKVYSFAKRLLASRVSHSTSTAVVNVRSRFVYDNAGRILKVYHQLNDQPEILMDAVIYNELGQLTNKSLHNVSNSNSYLQSIDYVYNIHGDIVKINDINSIAPDGQLAQEDYLAMELSYNSDVTDANNAKRFDGLLSAIQWKDDWSSKPHLYNFSYDMTSQLTDAVYMRRSPITWSSVDKFSEKGIGYDLNGNINALTRFQGNSTTPVDNLHYVYGSTGNQLKSVDDTGNAIGFKDGSSTGDDYSYDTNGNLTSDKNKGIVQIFYNTHDLPTKVSFQDNSFIEYGYDTDNNKIWQKQYDVTGQLTSRKDYADGFTYINDELAEIITPEGRIVAPAFNNLFRNRDANAIEGFALVGAGIPATVYIDGLSYLKVPIAKSSTTPIGIFDIEKMPGVRPTAMERYRFKVKGFSTTNKPAYLRVNSNNGLLVWQQVALPVGQSNEAWVTVEFTIPAGVTSFSCGVMYDQAAVGDEFYIERVALYKVDWEYQYDLKDHLGSPRVVLSSNPTTVAVKNTFETENVSTEGPLFLNVDYNFVVPSIAANQTLGGNEAIRMNRSYRVGPSRSMKVFPGDYVKAQVYAYYESVSGMTQAPVATMTAAVAGVLAGGNQAVIDGIQTAYAKSGTGVSAFALAPFQGTARPSAFINYILFDKDYQVLEAKSTPVGGTANALQLVTLPDVRVTELGYLFIYLSFDNDSDAWVYFDDLNIDYYESPAIQVNAYYPYGSMAYSWVRDGEHEDDYLFQNKEYNSTTGWHDFQARQYDATLGRWFAVDPKGQFASPYLAMANRPNSSIDPDGQWVHIVIGAVVGGFVNLGVKWARGQIQSPADGFAAFGIGAAAGAVGALTGGAAYAAIVGEGAAIGAGGFIAGAEAGFFGAAASAPIQSVGNTIYFHDPLMTTEEFGVNLVIGGVTGGLFNGGLAAYKGLNFWNGSPKLIPAYEALPVPALRYDKPDLTYNPKLDRYYMEAPNLEAPGGQESLNTSAPLGDGLPSLENNVALGVRETLDEFANNVNAATWKVWGTQNFEQQFLKVIDNPANKIHFNLDGITSPWAAVSEGGRGLANGSRVTSWELFQIYSNPSAMSRTTFYLNGKVVPNPFQ